MEHDGEVGKFLLDSLKHIESERRGNETAGLGVACTLLGSELVCAMGCADGDGEAVAAGAVDEVDHLLGVGVGVMVGAYLVLDAGENAELTLYSHVILVGIVHNLLCQSHVLLVRQVAAVDHYGRETVVDAVFAELEGITVVEVEHNLGMLPAERLGVFNGTLCHVAEQDGVGIGARSL